MPAQLAGTEAGLNLLADLSQSQGRLPQKKIEQLIELNEVQAAAILRQWLQEETRVEEARA
ncbi:hypothetical protein [Bosea lathyri]|nr:hypothetical protein [Bosea lathyri]